MTAKKRILAGVQNTGKLHLGNYYGALKEFLALQETGEALYFVANLHALNSLRNAELAWRYTMETAVAFLALGLDPIKATLFRQSDVPEVTELAWILGTVVQLADLRAAHAFKDKTSKGMESNYGVFAYPVLMAADILAYDADLVPVGKDQQQHIEFARDWAVRFNLTFCKGYNAQKPDADPKVFKLPLAVIRDATAVIPGRDGQKMSKSYANTIDLFNTDKELEAQVRRVATDSTAPDQPKPTDQALYGLLRTVLPPSEFATVDLAWREGGNPAHGYNFFKTKLLEGLHATFDGPRAEYMKLLAQMGHVEEVLTDGAVRARAYAAPVLSRVRRAVGITSASGDDFRA